MRSAAKMTLGALILVSPPGHLLAQQHEHGCAAASAAMPAELAAWPSRTPAAAAREKARLDKARLVIGHPVDAALSPTYEVRYLIRPEKPGGSASYGGMFAFDVREAGIYRVALGSGAWVDVLKSGKVMEASAHGHGPECSNIRKMVDFPLKRGRYVLQIAANGSSTLPLMLTKLP